MPFPNAVCVQIGKGGVGKTSLATNFAGLCSVSGMKVLLVDLDPQNNTRRDLGYEGSDGSAFLEAILNGTEMPVLKDVRSNLDVVPSGEKLEQIQAHAMSWFISGEDGFPARLEESLAPIAEDYDLIVIDTPPGTRLLYEAALEISRHVVIPTAGDAASLDGVELVAKRFLNVRARNPELTLAGIVLFATDARAQRVSRDVNTKLNDMLGGVAPLFESRIRNAKSASIDAREHGLLVHELENATEQLKKERLKALRRGEQTSAPLYSRNAGELAADYRAVTLEILDRIRPEGANTND